MSLDQLDLLEKWLGKNWREVQLYLHEDSTLMWYSGSDPDGGVLLKECPEMIAVGQVRLRITYKDKDW